MLNRRPEWRADEKIYASLTIQAGVWASLPVDPGSDSDRKRLRLVAQELAADPFRADWMVRNGRISHAFQGIVVIDLPDTYPYSSSTADHVLFRIEPWIMSKHREEVLGDLREDLVRYRSAGWTELELTRYLLWQLFWIAAASLLNLVLRILRG